MMTLKYVLMIAYTNYSSDPRVIREAESAVRGGYIVDFISLSREGDSQTEIINGVHVIHLNIRRYRGDSSFRYILSYLHFFLRALIKTTVLHIKKKYKVVHINNMPDFFVFTALLPKLTKAKVILDIHDPMPSTYLTKYNGLKKDLKYKLLLWEEIVSARFSDQVITVHEPLKNDVLVCQGIPANKIEVIANFTDANMFHLNNNYKVNEKLSIIFHGTISQRFGLDLVIKIFSQLECRDKFFLKIIGEGDYSNELKYLISKYELKDLVDFENKSYPANTLAGIISQYNIGLATYRLSPATDYMLPLKMLEYISTGIPVITVRNTAIKYYFGDWDLFFIDPVNFDPLNKILETCAVNPSVLLEKRKRILEIRSNFNWENEGRKYVRLLNDLSEVKN